MDAEWRELEGFLNAQNAASSRRRRPHRLPPETYRLAGVSFCLTLCARHHGTPFANAALADAVVRSLRFYHDRGQWRISAFCLMPDHLHVIVALADESPDDSREPSPALMALVGAFKSYTTSQVAWKHGLNGHLWQRDFYDHVARDATDLEEQCRYLLNNPIRRGLVDDWQDYRWSGLWDGSIWGE